MNYESYLVTFNGETVEGADYRGASNFRQCLRELGYVARLYGWNGHNFVELDKRC
jgi:hypothetical protein